MSSLGLGQGGRRKLKNEWCLRSRRPGRASYCTRGRGKFGNRGKAKEWGSPRIRKNVESGRGWHRQRLNVISRQPALSFSASGVPAGLAMKNRATERRFRGRRRLPEGAEIQKLGGLKFDLLLSAFLLFCLACDFI